MDYAPQHLCNYATSITKASSQNLLQNVNNDFTLQKFPTKIINNCEKGMQRNVPGVCSLNVNLTINQYNMAAKRGITYL